MLNHYIACQLYLSEIKIWWNPKEFRIKPKFLTVTFKVLDDLALKYLPVHSHLIPLSLLSPRLQSSFPPGKQQPLCTLCTCYSLHRNSLFLCVCLRVCFTVISCSLFWFQLKCHLHWKAFCDYHIQVGSPPCYFFHWTLFISQQVYFKPG